MEAVRAAILKAFPDAAAPAPLEFLTGAIVFDLENQVIVGALHPAEEVEAPEEREPELLPPAAARDRLDTAGCLLLGLLVLVHVPVYGAW